jgi:hypothetical protein
MSSQNRTTLKSYFNTGDYPTEAQFHNLIDSCVNLQDGGGVAGTTTMTGALEAKNATNYLGLHKFQGFVGTLDGINANGNDYDDGEIMAELGTLDTTVPSGFVAATKFLFTEFIIGIHTPMGANLDGQLEVGSATGQATHAAVTARVEVVGADVASFNPRISATDSVTEVPIDFNPSAGAFHIFTPYVFAPIANKYLYVCSGQDDYNSAFDAARFTVSAKYSVY